MKRRKKMKRKQAVSRGSQVHVEASPSMEVHVHASEAAPGNDADRALRQLRGG